MTILEDDPPVRTPRAAARRGLMLPKLLPAVAFFALSGCASFPRQENPAMKLRDKYAEARGPGCALNPYINNILALGLLEKGEGVPEAREYILWYLGRLNYPDKHGVTGSIYDQCIGEDGRESAEGNYDSVDSYAATFLLLLDKYVSAAGDTGLVTANWEKIKDVAFTIVYLQDKDGLVRALPDGDGKYLMDNCECYGGLLAFGRLSEAAGYGRDPYYEAAAEGIKAGIMANFYEPESGRFSWGMAGGVKSRYASGVFYPDALAQVFPALYGVSEDTAPLRGVMAEYGGRLGSLPLEQRLIIEMALKRAGEEFP
ncbi:MAG TPA: hypothetical protein PL037_05435 [Elusimicrobiales bacterium]|nr:hypothetical protein [Elusimicrobiales bacterium]